MISSKAEVIEYAEELRVNFNETLAIFNSVHDGVTGLSIELMRPLSINSVLQKNCSENRLMCFFLKKQLNGLGRRANV